MSQPLSTTSVTTEADRGPTISRDCSGDGRAVAEDAPMPARLYGRKRGRKLRPAQAARLDGLLPGLAIDLPPSGQVLQPAALFPRSIDRVWLEIGFGAGEHLAWQAARHPEVGLIGCEPFVQGIAQALRLVETSGVNNVRVFPNDARALVDALPDASVGRCFLLFPDPWPKRRHWPRRFLGPRTLDALARVLVAGAELRLASDHPAMIDWMLWQVRRHPAFDWTAARAEDWRRRPADWPATRYEAKALHGRPVFLRFRRIDGRGSLFG